MHLVTRPIEEGMTVWDEKMDIDAYGLSTLIKAHYRNTVIVDCRCFNEFNESHVKHSINAFFSKLMRRRLIENKLEERVLLDQIAGASCRELHPDMDVVLYADDQHKEPQRLCGKRRMASSMNAPENPAKILRVLRDQLEETGRFKRIMILQGGYNSFKSTFPQLCEGETMNRLPISVSEPDLSQKPQPEGPTQILPFLYLGSQQDALDTESMKRLGITFVINLSIQCPRAAEIDNENFMRIPINDTNKEKLSPFFERAWEFLEKVRCLNQCVLIHCLAGISRSPTLAISYIMRHKNMANDEAYEFVKSKRNTISPNFNFMGQLLEYENQLVERGILNPKLFRKNQEKDLKESITEARPELLDMHGCPAKVPKSASAHCVFIEQKFEYNSSIRVNENGKREMESAPPTPLSSLDRPRALGLGLKPKRTLPDELPSPSTEFSKLNFGACTPLADMPTSSASDFSTCVANPCFMSPTTPPEEPEELAENCPASASESNHSYFNRISNLFRKFPINRPSSLSTSRPDCLAGISIRGGAKAARGGSKINSPTLHTTIEEVESPESGFQEDSYKTSPEDADRVSLNSQSSVEIAVQ